MMRSLTLVAGVLASLLLTLPAAAQVPDAKTLLGELGFSDAEIQQVKSGQIVRGSIKAASERELVAAMAFLVKQTPTEIVADLKRGLGNQVDPAMIAFGDFSGDGSAADLSKLSFGADAKKRADTYLEAKPGGDVNLSSEEIASFNQLASSNPAPPAVESAVRSQLLARLAAYRKSGLDGIAPYALSDGKQRSAAEELKTATGASKALQKYVPAAYKMLLDYPANKPAGTEESFRWTHFDAHGTPTLSLQHVTFVPDGQAWVVAQRMFYVSSGFNAEQAILALVPVEGGTVVVYGNRTSTDQVTGFGGGTKRSIGSKLLEGQLETIFEKARAQAAN